MRDKKVLRYKIRNTEGGCLLQDTGGTRVHDTEYKIRNIAGHEIRSTRYIVTRYKYQMQDTR